MYNVIERFRDAIKSIGLIPPDVIEPGVMHRFPGAGKRNGNTAGWCRLHPDGLGGSFGDWSQDFKGNWQAERSTQFTQAERAAFARHVQESRAQAEVEKIAKQSEAAAMADSIWRAAQPAGSDHAYLKHKGIQAHGAKVHNGALAIPMREGAALRSLQFISADGLKRFLTEGKKKGCYFSIGNPKGATALCICEGFATGASIHEANGWPVAVAFDAGNLEAVALAIRARFPELALIICADDDANTEGNPGVTKATEAAIAVCGKLAIPFFGDDRTAKQTDFNDLAAHCGREAVQRCIAGAVAPTRAEHVPSAVNAPEPLPELPSVMAFDYSYLPDALRGYVRDISDRMQCPPDFAAVGVLVMIATIIGRKVGIRPMKHNDWTVICNLWAAVVGNSGVMKSPTLAAALSAIGKLAAAAFKIFNKAKAAYDEQAELAKLQQAVNKSAARASLKKDEKADVKGLLQSGETDDAPILKRYKTNNASYEALGELLMENPNGLMVESDEIIGLLKQLDAGGQEVARSFYLTAADGDKPYTFDRIMRGKGLHIEALCLSIIGGIQPGVLAEYVRQATGGGAGADGLLQRFGLMVYPDISPDWTEVDRYPDGTAREAVNMLAERLDNLNHADIGAEVDLYGGVPFLRFDDAAQVLFSEWRATLETRLRSGEEHPAIVSHLSKYRKLIPSLALINHLCDSRHGAVSEAALLRAIAFSEYLESHAQRIYSYATRPDIDAAKTLLKRLASGKLSSPFKARELSQKGWAGLESPSKAQSAIEVLLEYRHLIAEEVVTGGRPTTRYHWIKAGAV